VSTTGGDVLRIGSALPDPPFELKDGRLEGFDPAMMRAVAKRLGRRFELVRYAGADFDGIFAGLDDGAYDVVASGATITDHRTTLATFCRPYVRSGQSLVVAVDRHPPIESVDDLAGCTIGVQRGNTSEPVAEELARTGKVGSVRHYDYDDIEQALDDVAAGTIDAFMKLEPVMRWLTRDRPALRIAQTGITDERLAVAVRCGDDALRRDVDGALDAVRADGTLSELGRTWLGIAASTGGTQVLT
jgi:polar amino acid transport system substrate-binding protein